MKDYSTTENDEQPTNSTRRTTLKALGVMGMSSVGLSGTAAAHDGSPHDLLISAKDDTANYSFEVDGTVEKTDRYDATINSTDTVDGTAVTGRTTNEPDAFEFEGLITNFESDSPVAVYIDTTRVDQAAASDAPIEDEAAEGIEDAEADDSEEETEDEPEEEPEESDDFDSEIDESDYGNVVNIVDAGADNTGSSSILSTLREVADDDTLVKFPSGEYRMDGQLRITDYDRFGMVGDDATILVSPTDSYVFKLGTFRSPTTNLEVSGFTADISANNTGGRVFECQASDHLYVNDITIEGVHDTPSKGPFLAGLRSSDGEGLVENYSAPDGGEDVSGGNGGTGLLVSHYHEGSITLRDCEIGPFPDNGIYCSNADGEVNVEGGVCRNTNVAGVRLSGDNSSIDGTTFEYDEDIPGFDGQRAIRVDSGSNIEIRNVDITMSVSITEAIRIMSNAGSVLIADSSLDLTSSVRDAISVVQGGGPVELSNIDASGYDRYELFEY